MKIKIDDEMMQQLSNLITQKNCPFHYLKICDLIRIADKCNFVLLRFVQFEY